MPKPDSVIARHRPTMGYHRITAPGAPLDSADHRPRKSLVGLSTGTPGQSPLSSRLSPARRNRRSAHPDRAQPSTECGDRSVRYRASADRRRCAAASPGRRIGAVYLRREARGVPEPSGSSNPTSKPPLARPAASSHRQQRGASPAEQCHDRQVRVDDFFTESGLGLPYESRWFNHQLAVTLRSGSLPGRSDVEVAVPLARLVHDQFERFGTDGQQELTEESAREALLALRAVADRLGIEDFDPPFRDYGSFRSSGSSKAWPEAAAGKRVGPCCTEYSNHFMTA
jgi:hypothetical protein